MPKRLEAPAVAVGGPGGTRRCAELTRPVVDCCSVFVIVGGPSRWSKPQRKARGEAFTANDCDCRAKAPIAVVTGPLDLAGKSTHLR